MPCDKTCEVCQEQRAMIEQAVDAAYQRILKEAVQVMVPIMQKIIKDEKRRANQPKRQDE